jgi:anti-sigma B factor antagonist
MVLQGYLMAGRLELRAVSLTRRIVRIDIEGSLDVHAFERLDEFIASQFRKGIHRLVVMLDRVDYLSSAGAGVFIGAVGTARAGGGDIVLVNPSPSARLVLEQLGLMGEFRFAKDETEATRLFVD